MKKLFYIMLMLCLVNSSCKNLYLEMASTDTDASILYSARLALAEGDWTLALTEFARLSDAALAEPEVVVDRASAYSGRCGLDFLALSSLIQNIGTTPFMEFLSDNFVATSSANSADCKLAEDLLKTVANASGVVSTERGQFLMAFSSLAKIGTILNNYSDTNDDDVVDAGWDPCDGNGAIDLPANDVNEIGTAIVLFYKNLENTSYGSALVAPIVAFCAVVNGTAADFCDVIDVTVMTATHRQAIRGMIRETADGIGLQIAAGNASANACQP